jgi:recombination protein RecT
VLAAVAGDCELLLCSRPSLHGAIDRAANDGLMPDGKEGFLSPNKRVAEWRPAVHGLRKRFMEHGFILDADVVHENDDWDYERGDSPFIRHKPADARKRLPRGQMCAAYCILRTIKDDGTSEITHREVMDWEEIEGIKGMLANKDSALWTRHEREAWKKSAVHRLAKTFPLVPELAQIFERENSYVDWDAEEAYLRQGQAGAESQDPLRDPDIDLTEDLSEDADAIEAIVSDKERHATPPKEAA